MPSSTGWSSTAPEPPEGTRIHLEGKISATFALLRDGTSTWQYEAVATRMGERLPRFGVVIDDEQSSEPLLQASIQLGQAGQPVEEPVCHDIQLDVGPPHPALP